MKWSKLRKLLEEEYLCPALQGRVQYFVTKYREAHDQQGRVSVRVDGIDVLQMNFILQYQIASQAGQRLQDDENYGKSIHVLYDGVSDEFAVDGKFEPGEFGLAARLYLQCSIEDALYHHNLLVRMLAVLDRRVGRHTLLKLVEHLDDLPEWLRYFYQLRLEAGGII